MKKVLKSLVLIWVYTLTIPACASENLFAPVSTIERMYIGKQEEKRNDFETETTSSSAPKKEKESRLKRIYIGVYGGYFYTKDDMTFTDSNHCKGAYTADFLCTDGKENPIALDYKDDYFLSASFGINSANPLRVELSYFQLGQAIDIQGTNTVGIDSRNYYSNIDLKGGSVNVYFDFVANRNKPYFVFVPYVMAGIGASEIDLGDVSFKGTSDSDFIVLGKVQRNRTIVYGAGITAGLNNYISLDIGYRYYNFGTIETENTLKEIAVDGTETLKELQMQTDLEAHIATIGLKFQI